MCQFCHECCDKTLLKRNVFRARFQNHMTISCFKCIGVFQVYLDLSRRILGLYHFNFDFCGLHLTA